MDYLLWHDFETTGLNPKMDTILEFAWTITDSELVMRTPLRARLCLIDPGNRRRDAHLFPGHPLRDVTRFEVGDVTSDEAHHHWHLLPEVVQEMHAETGLRDALAGTVNDPVGSLTVLRNANDLERLIVEDLIALRFNRDTDRLILAGAGVSHFDNRVLAHHLPTMFPLGGGGPLNLAYWQHDVSVARRVIGEQAFTELKTRINNDRRAVEIFGCEVVLPDEGYAPVRVNQVPDWADFGGAPFVFMQDEFTGHRAADDVAWALIDGRILRKAVRW